MLIVAPHPDDDCIGCGGLLSLFPSQCDVLLVTDGYDETLGNLELSQQRFKEFENAMRRAGVHQYWGLHIPEHQIDKHNKSFKQVDFTVYTKVFMPNRYEYHQDHIAVYNMIKRQLRTQNSRAQFWEYEIWTTIRFPNLYVDISSVIQKKRELILEYQTQMAQLDYTSLALGLNSYRGKTKQMEYAEAFFCESEARAEKRRALKRYLKTFWKRLHNSLEKNWYPLR